MALRISISFFVFLLGACWGSFLNCLVYRWEQGKRINSGRSFCPKCRHQLGFWDLIPVASFVFLKRKCRYCGGKISWQYFLAETATGGLFLASYILFHNDFTFLVFSWPVIILLVIIFIYDLKHYIIPDRVIYSAIGIVFFYRLFAGHEPFFGFLWAALAAAGFFFCIWAVSRGRWMGFGDVKLAFFMGLFLGLPGVILALFAAFLSGAATGVILLALGRKKMQSQVPFGPFLVAGTFIGLFWGDKIIRWYLNLSG